MLLLRLMSRDDATGSKTATQKITPRIPCGTPDHNLRSLVLCPSVQQGAAHFRGKLSRFKSRDRHNGDKTTEQLWQCSFPRDVCVFVGADAVNARTIFSPTDQVVPGEQGEAQ